MGKMKSKGLAYEKSEKPIFAMPRRESILDSPARLSLYCPEVGATGRMKKNVVLLFRSKISVGYAKFSGRRIPRTFSKMKNFRQKLGRNGLIAYNY